MARFTMIKKFFANIKHRHEAKNQQLMRSSSVRTEEPPSYFEAVYGTDVLNREIANDHALDQTHESYLQYRMLIDYSVLDIDDPQMPDEILDVFVDIEPLEDLIVQREYHRVAERLAHDLDWVAELFGETSDVTEIIRNKIKEFARQCVLDML